MAGNRGSRATPPSSNSTSSGAPAPYRRSPGRSCKRAQEERRRQPRTRAGRARRRRRLTHIARPKVLRQNNLGAARRAIPSATTRARAQPRTGPTVPARRPHARGRHSARSRRQDQASSLDSASPAVGSRRDQRPSGRADSDRRGRTRTRGPPDVTTTPRKVRAGPLATRAERVEPVVRHQAPIHQFAEGSPHPRRLDRGEPRQIGHETGAMPVRGSRAASVRQARGRPSPGELGARDVLRSRGGKRRHADLHALCPRHARARHPGRARRQARPADSL